VITHFEQTIYEPLGRDFQRDFSRKYLSSNSVERLLPKDLLDLERPRSKKATQPTRSRSPTPNSIQNKHFQKNLRIPKRTPTATNSLKQNGKNPYENQPFPVANTGSFTSFDPQNCQSSKRELISNAFLWMNDNFGSNFDTMGRRGENVMRLKVKTLKALQHIVTFLELCVAKDLIKGISAPLSTKRKWEWDAGGRKQYASERLQFETRSRSSRSRNRLFRPQAYSSCRGFLAYIEAFSPDKVQEVVKIFNTYQEANWNPFSALECGVV